MRHVFDVQPPHASPYPVLCGEDPAPALARLWQPAWEQAVIIGDENTSRLFADPLAQALAGRVQRLLRLSFPAGERHKTRQTKARLEDAMLAAGIDRRACIVAVGGGVVLDVAGFVAATFLRAVAHVNVATTLLAQVDAALGGKTGVNTPRGKNLVGAFHHPRAVLLDAGALSSLPASELRAGLAEAVKHAAVADARLFARIEAWSKGGSLRLPDEIIVRCARVKAGVVARDDRDQGLRHILNFGHSVGHAIEHATVHRTAHGPAVAIGMAIEARVAAAEGTFPERDLRRLAALLGRLGLPTAAPCDFAAAQPFLASDKKRRGAGVRCAIPRRIGTSVPGDGSFTREVSLDALRAAWEEKPLAVGR
ncbi:MAG: 3-dehydroquinate synthase [Deltaproteobacteria bacterium]|nr:3-dehydroquinate synthase [Deltaproteobacteria bacterium]